jgi:hypothetical protein
MAYSELVKNFERIRDYMREFYVYGFRTRGEMTEKSIRSYDEERRHIEDYLGDYMGFRTTPEGKQVFLSIDSRSSAHNPLYQAWKAKSFTDADIFLHFTLLDILQGEECISQQEIMEKMEDYNSFFQNPMTLDESTIRKKLKEYTELGILVKEKRGRTVVYSRTETPDCTLWRDAIAYFSEVESCGVIGSFLLDILPGEDVFTYKHHYITQAMDSEICLKLLTTIHERRFAEVENRTRRSRTFQMERLTPLKIYISTQNGRQYLMAWCEKGGRMKTYRLDYIRSVKVLEVDEEFERKCRTLEQMGKNLWGISFCGKPGQQLTHVDFTVEFAQDQQYIYERLLRERRCGQVERLSETEARFTAEVYDAGEMLPWIRTFICRIKSIHISNPEIEERFLGDLKEMYKLYGLEDTKAADPI